MKIVYLDNAATTPLLPEVLAAMNDCLTNTFGNPSSTHAMGRKARTEVELCRKTIASQLNAKASEIIFTSGCTEANNWILWNAVEQLGVSRIISSPLEHKSVLNSLDSLSNKANIVWLPVQEKGHIDLTHLAKTLSENTEKTLVCLMHGNNELGNLLNINEVARICQENQALFHSDCAQTFGHYPLNVKKTFLDSFAFSAHKLHGPKGIGFLYIRSGNKLKALIKGGLQERGLRAGTENVSGIVGLHTAVDLAFQHLNENTEKVRQLKRYTIGKLQILFPSISFNGHSQDFEKSMHSLLSINIPIKNSMLAFQLDLKGIYLSQGSACNSGSTQSSSVLDLVTSPETKKNTTPLRISFSHLNTEEEIDRFLFALSEIVTENNI